MSEIAMSRQRGSTPSSLWEDRKHSAIVGQAASKRRAVKLRSPAEQWSTGRNTVASASKGVENRLRLRVILGGRRCQLKDRSIP